MTDTRFSFFPWLRARPTRPPVALDDVVATPLPRKDLDDEARRIADRIGKRAREVSRLSLEIQDMAESFLKQFEGRG